MPAAMWPLSPELLLPVTRSPGKKLVVTPFEDGLPATRLRYLAAPGMMPGELRLTGEEFAAFLSFGEDLLQEWSQPFLWRDPTDGGVLECTFAGEPEYQLEAAAGSGDPDRTVWSVRLKLWVMR